MPLDRNNLQGM